jgi:hypothetical protein
MFWAITSGDTANLMMLSKVASLNISLSFSLLGEEDVLSFNMDINILKIAFTRNQILVF